VDEYRHNPVGTIPTERFGRLERKHLSIEEAQEDEWHEGKPTPAWIGFRRRTAVT